MAHKVSLNQPPVLSYFVTVEKQLNPNQQEINKQKINIDNFVNVVYKTVNEETHP